MLGLKNQNVNKSSAGLTFFYFTFKIINSQLTFKIKNCSWVPVFADDQQRLSVMSIGFLLPNEDAPVIWRGPKKTGNFFLIL